MATPDYDTLEDLLQIDIAELEWVRNLIEESEFQKIYQEVMEDDPRELVLPELNQRPPSELRKEVKMDNAWCWPADMVKEEDHMDHDEVFTSFQEVHRCDTQKGGYAHRKITTPQPSRYLQHYPRAGRDMMQFKKQKAFQCMVCGKSYASQRSLHNHSFAHTGIHPYKCEICKMTFRYHTRLKEHQRLMLHCGGSIVVRNKAEE